MIDITKIPKFIIWGAIAIFIILILSFSYLVIKYKMFKPYQQFLEIDCTYTNNTAIVILSAKANLENVTISDFSDNDRCFISKINKDSMDGCKIKTMKIGDKVYIKVKFYVNKKEYKAISECKIVERKSLLDLILKR